MKIVKRVLPALGFIAMGILLGGYLFTDVQPRSVFAIHRCEQRCLRPNELMGLIGSVVTQKMPGILPVLLETDHSIVIESPQHLAPVHYVIIPKKDIRDAGEITEEDASYFIDAYTVMRYLIEKKHLKNYQIFTNGPGIQHVTYLHFHLLAHDSADSQ
jgi:hypothetical protein